MIQFFVANAWAGEAVSSNPVTATSDALIQLQKTLAHPAVQAYLKFFSSPAFSRGAEQIMSSPNLKLLLYVQLGWIVFMLIFRAWRLSKGAQWYHRLWTHGWTFVLFWIGALIAIPWATLGRPYFDLLTGAVAVMAAV